MAPDVNSDDYYKVLGLDRGASDAEISKAYKKLALKYHPDKNQDDKENAEAVFKRISEAYSTLSDPEKKKMYDQFGKDGMNGGGMPGGFGGGGGMSFEQADDIFQMFFGGGVPGGFGGMGGGPGRGQRVVFNMGGPGGGGDMGGMDLGSLFGGMGGMGGMPGMPGMSMGGAGPSRQRRPPPRTPSYAYPVGSVVVIRGLTQAREHNGKTGTVQGFNEAKGRYDIKVEGAGSTVLSLKPQSLTRRCNVEVTGLESKPELNGKVGEIFKFDEDSGRYTVLLQSPATGVSLQRGNCILESGTPVLLTGLNKADFNGQMAQITGVDRSAARYVVRCQSGTEIKVKYENVVC